MRNGMSVQEIYEKLDQFDRLKEAYDKELEGRMKLERYIQDVIQHIERTMNDYKRISLDHKTSYEDKCEFRNRYNGLLEALVIMKMKRDLNDDANVLAQRLI